MTSAFTCLAPKETHSYVIVKPGNPIQILDQKDGAEKKVSAFGRTLKDGSMAQQDVTGWVAMPPEHWEQIKKVLEDKEK